MLVFPTTKPIDINSVDAYPLALICLLATNKGIFRIKIEKILLDKEKQQRKARVITYAAWYTWFEIHDTTHSFATLIYTIY